MEWNEKLKKSDQERKQNVENKTHLKKLPNNQVELRFHVLRAEALLTIIAV